MGAEDDPCVVVEVSDRAEVEAHDVAESVALEQVAHAAQLVQRPLRSPVAHEAGGRVEDLGPAAQRREAQQQLVLRGPKRGARQEVFERHEIPGRER